MSLTTSSDLSAQLLTNLTRWVTNSSRVCACVCVCTCVCVFGVELKLSLKCSTMTLPWRIGKELGPSELFVPNILIWYVAGPNFRYRCNGRMQLCFKETKILRKSREWYLNHCVLNKMSVKGWEDPPKRLSLGKKKNVFERIYLCKEFILTLLPCLSLSLWSDWRIDVPLWSGGGGGGGGGWPKYCVKHWHV